MRTISVTLQKGVRPQPPFGTTCDRGCCARRASVQPAARPRGSGSEIAHRSKKLTLRKRSSQRGACGARANAPMVHQSRSIDVHQRASACGMSVHRRCTKRAPTMHLARSHPLSHASPCRAVEPTLRVTRYASPATCLALTLLHQLLHCNACNRARGEAKTSGGRRGSPWRRAGRASGCTRR
jgi:hypothetical protein